MKKIENYLTYLFIVVLSLTPVLWLGNKPNTLINGLDTNFPLDPLSWLERRFYTWNNIANAGSDFSYGSAGVFFHTLQSFFYILGFSLHYVELFTLIFWFTLIVFSAYTFLRVYITKNNYALMLGVFIYSWNLYLYNTWENIKVTNIAVMIAIPLFLSLLKLHKEKHIKHIYFVPLVTIVSFITVGSGINPAYFLTYYSALVLYVVLDIAYSNGKTQKLNALKANALGLVVILISNFFWIIPLFRNLLFINPVSSVEEIGFTNWIDSLSQNTSILNILRLMGAWDWYAVDGGGLPLYIPYALNYFKNPIFIAFSFVLPLLAFGSYYFVNKKNQKIYLYFGLLLIVGVFMGAGTHPPTGGLYKLFVRIIPQLSFFRSPWYIFTPYLLLAYAGLAALLIHNVFDKFGKINIYKKYNFDLILKLFVLVLLMGHFFYSYPIWTGKIFRPGREDSFFVQVPEYVYEADKWLEDQNDINRILVYPDDALESYTWRYRGTESILRLFSEKEFVSRSFNISNQGFAILYEQVYADLKRGDFDNAISSMRVAGVDAIMIRRDARTFSPELENEALMELGEHKQIGEWIFVKPTALENNQKIYLSNTPLIYLDSSGAYPAPISEYINLKSYSIHPNEEAFPDDYKLNAMLVTKAEKNQDKYNLLIPSQSQYVIYVEKNFVDINAENISIEGVDLSNIPAESNDNFIAIGPINLEEGQYNITIDYPESRNLIPNDYARLSDTFGLSSSDLPESNDVLVVSNYEKDLKRFDIEIPNFNIFYSYILNFDYKFVTGNPPVLDIYQYKGKTPLQVSPINLPPTQVYTPLSLSFAPVDIGSNLKLSIRMDGAEKFSKSVSFFKNMEFKRVYDNEIFAVEEVTNTNDISANVNYEKVNPAKYRINIENVLDNFVLIFSDSYSPDWALITKEGNVVSTHFKANGYANAWQIKTNSDNLELEIRYKNQTVFRNSIILSIILLTGLWVYPVIINRRKRN